MAYLLASGRKFLRLTGAEQRIVLEAAVALLTSWTGLRCFGFRRWARGRMRPSAAGEAPMAPEVLAKAQKIAALTAGASRHLWPRTNCLEQALALQVLLKRRGIAAKLRLGARKDAERFEAHAWLEVGGVPLYQDGGAHRHFVPFTESLSEMET